MGECLSDVMIKKGLDSTEGTLIAEGVPHHLDSIIYKKTVHRSSTLENSNQLLKFGSEE